MYCRNCANELVDGAVACTACGVNPLRANKFCNSCGEATAENAVICIKCGVSTTPSSGAIKIPDNISVTGDGNVVESGTAILWALVCMPIGFAQWGQTVKGWAWVGISAITCGAGGIGALIDYVMCYNAQKTRKLEEWEFFPKS